MIEAKMNILLILRNMAIYILIIMVVLYLSNAKPVHRIVFLLLVVMFDIMSKLKFLLLSISVKSGFVTLKFIINFRKETKVLATKELQLIIKKGHIARTLFGDILVIKIKDEDLGKVVLGSSGWTRKIIMEVNEIMGVSKQAIV
ncbi:MAG: hypothetical protein IPI46_06430 [Bacteroidetes bacterium]|nr:hypothetical protein [Bacteroidota bacterium]